MEKLETWKKLSRPPKDALKTIGAGRLKGKSDINPQWRYEVMTEVFGVCGIGWKFEIEATWIDEAPLDQKVQNAKILLYIRHSEQRTTPVWSDPIPGIGGSMLVVKEKAGLHTNDEAVKMAVTDALGTAMKMIGVASDIYRGAWDGSKYREPSGPKPKREQPEKLTAVDIKFYKTMTEYKEHFGEEEYRNLLGTNGYESSKDIPVANREGALKFFAKKLEILKEEGGR